MNILGAHVVGHTLYKLLLLKGQKFQEIKLFVTLADGSRKLESLLTTMVDVTLENRIVPTKLIIFPEAENNCSLLGMDFIEDALLVINIPQRIW